LWLRRLPENPNELRAQSIWVTQARVRRERSDALSSAGKLFVSDAIVALLELNAARRRLG
jgi:hypothetical protein